METALFDSQPTGFQTNSHAPLFITHLPNELTTINKVFRASHIARIIRKQQNSLANHFLGLSKAFERDVRCLVGSNRGVHARRLVRVHVSRGERVHTNTVRRPFGRETLADVGDRGF